MIAFREYRLTVGNVRFTFFNDLSHHAPAVSDAKAMFHTHLQNEIFYITDGEVDIRTQTETLHLNRGDLALIPKGTLHETRGSDATRRITWGVALRRLRAPGEKDYASAFFPLFGQKNVTVVRNFQARDCFQRMIDYQSGTLEDKEELIVACLHEMLFLLKNALSAPISDAKKTLEEDNPERRNYIADRYINENYGKHPTVAQLAKLIHVTPQQMQRQIRRQYGQNFKERIRYLKMQNAARLLAATDLSVSEISAAVGYGSAHGFFTAFRRTFGKTPGEYRKEQKQTNQREE